MRNTLLRLSPPQGAVGSSEADFESVERSNMEEGANGDTVSYDMDEVGGGAGPVKSLAETLVECAALETWAAVDGRRGPTARRLTSLVRLLELSRAQLPFVTRLLTACPHSRSGC